MCARGSAPASGEKQSRRVKCGAANADHNRVGDRPISTGAYVSELSPPRAGDGASATALAHSRPIQGGALTQSLGDGRPGRLIGDVVVDLGFATRERVEEAVEIARSQRKPTGQVLVEQGILRHDQLA